MARVDLRDGEGERRRGRSSSSWPAPSRPTPASASSSTRTSVLAGAIAAGWKGPVFIQGDHYQFNAKKYAADPEKMTEEIRKACRDAIAAGYRNIDIDSSTLVDLSHDDASTRSSARTTSAPPS